MKRFCFWSGLLFVLVGCGGGIGGSTTTPGGGQPGGEQADVPANGSLRAVVDGSDLGNERRIHNGGGAVIQRVSDEDADEENLPVEPQIQTTGTVSTFTFEGVAEGEYEVRLFLAIQVDGVEYGCLTPSRRVNIVANEMVTFSVKLTMADLKIPETA